MAALVFFEIVVFFNLMGVWLCHVFNKKIKERVYDGRFLSVVREAILPRLVFLGSAFVWLVFAQVNLSEYSGGVGRFVNIILFFWFSVSFSWFYMENINILERVIFSPYFKFLATAYGAFVAVFSSFYVDSYLSRVTGVSASLLGGVDVGMIIIFSLFIWGMTISIFLLFVGFLYALRNGDDYKEEASMIFCCCAPFVTMIGMVVISSELLGSPNIERKIVDYVYHNNFKIAVAENKIEDYRDVNVRDVAWCTNLLVSERILFLPNGQVSLAREVDGVYRFQIEDCVRDPIKVENK